MAIFFIDRFKGLIISVLSQCGYVSFGQIGKDIEIKDLFNGILSIGTHTTMAELKGHESGIYICKIKNGSLTGNIKVLLQR